MEEIIKLDEVDKYNKFFGLETRHPLVSVVDLSKSDAVARAFQDQLLGVCPFRRIPVAATIMYGRQSYDLQDGTIRQFRAGQVVETRCRKIPGRMPTASCSTPT